MTRKCQTKTKSGINRAVNNKKSVFYVFSSLTRVNKHLRYPFYAYFTCVNERLSNAFIKLKNRSFQTENILSISSLYLSSDHFSTVDSLSYAFSTSLEVPGFISS